MLNGKVAIISGAGRGLGLEIAKSFAKNKCNLTIFSRTQSEIEQSAKVLKDYKIDFLYMVSDISNVWDCERVVSKTIKHFGKIDILVNNAAILGMREELSDYSFDIFENVLKVNTTGLFYLTKFTLKEMIKQKDGSIINLSSFVGRFGKEKWGAYSISKFAVEGLTQILAKENQKYNIRVNSVDPGRLRTRMRASAYPDEDPNTLVTPDYITPCFLYLASEKSKQITGQTLEAQEWIKNNPSF